MGRLPSHSVRQSTHPTTIEPNITALTAFTDAESRNEPTLAPPTHAGDEPREWRLVPPWSMLLCDLSVKFHLVIVGNNPNMMITVGKVADIQ